MSASPVVAIYESVAQITSQMLAAAKEQDWEKLAELEDVCAKHVEQLKAHQNDDGLSSSDLDRKVASIKRILADDREIRNLVDPWMVKLSAMISSNKAERKLHSAYRQ